MREEQKIEAEIPEKRAIGEKTGMKFEKVERDVRYEEG